MAKFGKHFSLSEMTFSQTATRRGMLNAPNREALESLHALVANILDPLREHLGMPIVVSSGFRSLRVNELVGGSPNSQHCLGQAADIHVPSMPVADLARTIRELGLPFDQLIDEFGRWVHVSYSPQHRRQALVARTIGGKTTYLPMGG